MGEHNSTQMSEKQKEMSKRKRIWNKKMRLYGLLILVSFACFFLAGFVPTAMINLGCSEVTAHVVNMIFRGIHCIGVIVGVLGFAKALHDPLTDKEAEELAEQERREKTGN